MNMEPSIDINVINEKVSQQTELIERVFAEADRVIVGQRSMIERLFIGLICGGHVLLEGVPGLAKTLTVSTVARIISASFKRVQFTPDLLPADITGTLIYNQQDGKFIAKKGPIFANLVLADEINRAPAKVQSALLECMQEGQVTIGDETYFLPEPFMVLATQNPIEQEGTYSLPEAQMDRFMLKVKVTYPSRDNERSILDRMGDGKEISTQEVLNRSALSSLREVVRMIYVDDKIKDYIVDLVYATRSPKEVGIADLEALIENGASPRATIFLLRAARGHAFLRGRSYVTPEDVKTIGMDVLRHRIVPSYEAEAEEIDSDSLVQMLFDHVEVP
jgi:MoxR-like ATPase